MAEAPNILFLFADDQRFDTIAALGNPEIHTPNFDALVARGCSFTRAHIPGGTSGAVCMPSRAMLHTGRTLFHLQDKGEQIPEDHRLLGEVFRESGYKTFGTGKWHNGKSSYARSFTHGDEIFFGGMGDHWNVPAYHYDPSGKYDNKLPFIRNFMERNQVKYRHGDHIPAGVHSTDLFTRASCQFLQDHGSDDQPFFMYVSLMAPHDPRSMPAKYMDMYDPASIALPANFLPEHPIDTGALRIRDEMLAGFPRTADEVRAHIAEYYGMIMHIDDALGQLVDELHKQGQYDNTIIVFAGDNGLAVGQHGLMGKQNLYDHSVRVPLIFAGPGIPEGETRAALVYLLDIFPTLCELSNIPIPETVEGKSLVPSMRDAHKTVRDTLYLAYLRNIRGVTTGKHKFIQYACGATQLFDLERDPCEANNLAASSEYKQLVADLRAEMFRMADEWDDAQPEMGKAYFDMLAVHGIAR